MANSFGESADDLDALNHHFLQMNWRRWCRTFWSNAVAFDEFSKAVYYDRESASVMKNWLPAESDPDLAIERTLRSWCRSLNCNDSVPDRLCPIGLPCLGLWSKDRRPDHKTLMTRWKCAVIKPFRASPNFSVRLGRDIGPKLHDHVAFACFDNGYSFAFTLCFPP